MYNDTMAHDALSKALSQNLRSIRRSKGLTAVDLAKVLGVSQAKISYIENCKGILSARDIAVLSKKLNVPVTDFFRGLDTVSVASDRQQVVGQLVHYGATFLAKPAGILLKEIPFEEVVSEALGFIDDDRIRKGFCVALISQASRQEINSDRIFALIGSNAFLVIRLREVVRICGQIIRELTSKGKTVTPRAERQLRKIGELANGLIHQGYFSRPQTIDEAKMADAVASIGEIGDLAAFVEESLDAKK
jgi:transcriptional regulator with XRE-family HTH domain